MVLTAGVASQISKELWRSKEGGMVSATESVRGARYDILAEPLQHAENSLRTRKVIRLNCERVRQSKRLAQRVRAVQAR